jgi:predicted Na+-dependent transporter
MVVVPTILGVTINETSRGKVPDIIGPYINPIAKICLMLVISANTSSVAAKIRPGDPMVWKVAARVLLLCAGSFVLSKFAGKVLKCNYEKGVTLFFSGSLRNVTSTATIAVTFFSETVALPLIILIVFQHTVSVILAKLLIKNS